MIYLLYKQTTDTDESNSSLILVNFFLTGLNADLSWSLPAPTRGSIHCLTAYANTHLVLVLLRLIDSDHSAFVRNLFSRRGTQERNDGLISSRKMKNEENG